MTKMTYSYSEMYENDKPARRKIFHLKSGNGRLYPNSLWRDAILRIRGMYSVAPEPTNTKEYDAIANNPSVSATNSCNSPSMGHLGKYNGIKVGEMTVFAASSGGKSLIRPTLLDMKLKKLEGEIADIGFELNTPANRDRYGDLSKRIEYIKCIKCIEHIKDSKYGGGYCKRSP